MASSSRKYPKDLYVPKPEHKFTFGLWTVGNLGRDPFGDAVRSPLSPARIVAKLSELGAYGVNLHDNDLIPLDASPAERELIVREFSKVLRDNGMKVPMATTNLFYDPIFKEGAFTANDARVRQFALQKTMRAIDLGAELGATVYVFWGGREGVETNACKTPQEAAKRFRECLNFLCEYVIDRKYDLRLALEAKPNEPRGDIWLPTSGHMLAFIETLDHSDMVGVNPEVAHEQMSGLDFSHAVGQALDAGKLFHIDLNDQKPGRYDQDLRFGSENQKGAFFLVKLLEDAKWDGMRHFDSHPYRTEDEEGVWEFAYDSMRTYLILKDKAEQWNRDPEIQGILEDLRELDRKVIVDTGANLQYNARLAQQLEQATFDLPLLRAQGYRYEKLDQLTIEVLLGVR